MQRIEEAGGEAFALGADVADREPRPRCWSTRRVARFGALDILVNNAGIWKGSPDRGDVRRRVARDARRSTSTGTFHCIRAAVPPMKEARSGRIVNVSSTAGQRGEAVHAHYAATKGARDLARPSRWPSSSRPFGILVNCVAPGLGGHRHDARTTLGGPAREAILRHDPAARNLWHPHRRSRICSIATQYTGERLDAYSLCGESISAGARGPS